MFEECKFSVLSYANGFTLWHYSDERLTKEDFLQKKNFFGTQWRIMNSGDKVMIRLKDAWLEAVVVLSMNNKVVIKTLIEEDIYFNDLDKYNK